MKTTKWMLPILSIGLMCSASAAPKAPSAKAAPPATAQTAKPAPAAKPAPQQASPAIWEALPAVVAVVDGKNITRKDVETFLRSQMPDGNIPPMFTAELLKQMAPGIVRGMVEQQLMEKEIAKSNIKVTAQMVEAELRKELESMTKEQRAMLEQQFKMQNTTLDKRIQEMASNPQLQKQFALRMFLEKNIISKVKKVTDAEAKAFYDKNINQFKRPEMLQVSHILFVADEKANDKAAADKAALEKAIAAYKELQKTPAKFEEIAKKESACPSKAQGGKLQPFPKGQGVMVKEFEDAAAAIDTKGKIVGPVKTQYGYHLIRLDAVIPAATEPFDKAKASIEAYLNGQAQQKAIADYMAQLMKANKVEFKLAMPQGMPQGM